ncbi:MAG: Fic family protein [Candidatus Kapabacteria bacterium]|nr:Fic family protein [Candidatus Kapabacteria bacterium]
MFIKNFISGTYRQQYEFKSFYPESINHYWALDDNETIALLSEANIKLGELNAFSQLIPSVDLFIKMHIRKEATLSSKIEGTQTNIEESLQDIDEIKLENRDDWQEVINYVDSMNYAISMLSELPISNRLILNTHKILMKGVRGERKTPGEFRKSQNWIEGNSIKNATYVPPIHIEIQDLISDMEKFIHNDELRVPELIKIAIIHYQFETIHPFLDGNGRIGRLLITLYLVSKGLLLKPALYLSDYFDRFKPTYYECLTRIRTENDMNYWLKYFLIGIRDTAQNSIDTFKAIIELKNDIEINRITTLGKKQKLARAFMPIIFDQPIIDMSLTAERLKVNKSTASRILEDFVALGILIEKTGFKRNRKFEFKDYIDLFR